MIWTLAYFTLLALIVAFIYGADERHDAQGEGAADVGSSPTAQTNLGDKNV